jgi:tetratricopeptide (TPR) repeat protein
LGGHELLRAWLLNDLGAVLQLQGEKDGALAKWMEALSLKEKTLGHDHPDVGVSEGNLAIALAELGRPSEALAHVDRALQIMRQGLGSGHPDLAEHFLNRGEVLTSLARYEDARQSFESARAIWERELGPDNIHLAYALTGIGLNYLSQGKSTNALVPLERAFKIRDSREAEPSRRAETSFALARALWDSNRNRARARSLAEQSLEEYGKADAKPKVAEVQAWLQTRAAN